MNIRGLFPSDSGEIPRCSDIYSLVLAIKLFYAHEYDSIHNTNVKS